MFSPSNPGRRYFQKNQNFLSQNCPEARLVPDGYSELSGAIGRGPLRKKMFRNSVSALLSCLVDAVSGSVGGASCFSSSTFVSGAVIFCLRFPPPWFWSDICNLSSSQLRQLGLRMRFLASGWFRRRGSRRGHPALTGLTTSCARRLGRLATQGMRSWRAFLSEELGCPSLQQAAETLQQNFP